MARPLDPRPIGDVREPKNSQLYVIRLVICQIFCKIVASPKQFLKASTIHMITHVKASNGLVRALEAGINDELDGTYKS
ncbi:hypothetical protein NC652_033054 [Populus alba x Populus x berolinensis]|uniref:Uncharacterized protein n=1 Tax=Populus alba x Populus x berolinensis TaxID=444605 RepID=A0AAD6LSM9_9ROSI|nr:hypothetical protein NC652_033054 [Populus alba x Populus x berolinensis]KAJ6972568.1 hypothetical protein NC653_032999 [Populus alba x Populus x berolinensis]